MPPRTFTILLAAFAALAACGGEETNEAPPAAAGAQEIVAIRHGLPIVAEARREAAVVGRLRLGARIAHGGPVDQATDDCVRGWYAVEPRGFVCLDDGAVLESDERALPPPAEAPLPYRYARVRRGGAVRYEAAPTHASRLLAQEGKPKSRKERRLGAGANDVPLDEERYPTGPAVVRADAWGVGADGYRLLSEWFDFDGPAWDLTPGDRLKPVAPTILAELAQRIVVGHKTLRRRSGVAVAATTKVNDRHYAITPDGGVVAVDRLEPALGTPWHGVDLRNEELPLGFALRTGVKARSFLGGEPAIVDVEYVQNEPIFLSGRYRTANQRRYYHTKDGRWLRHEDLIIIFPRDAFPDFATEGQRWIDVSLANQTLVAYEGKKALYATLISSGRKRLGDPDKEPATPQGVFHVVEKAVTIDVDPREVANEYAIAHAPWALVTDDERVVLVGNYWQRRFAWARGHHFITVAPVDAFWLFHFVGPALPSGWHAVREPSDAIVYVHK